MTQLLFIISISKHIHVASVGEIGFDMMNEKNKFNCIFLVFCKFKNSIFLVFKFNVPCGSHFMAYFNK
jgi:hypothetical protein